MATRFHRRASRMAPHERVRFIEHDGTSILLSDLSGIESSEELQGAVRLGTELLQGRPPKSVLVLVDLTGVEYSLERFAIVQQSVAVNRPYVRARAIVGLTRFASAAFQVVAKLSGGPMASFDDVDEAMEWLVGHRAGG
jgi:hypothetical protein